MDAQIRKHLQALELPEAPVEWLMALWRSIQMLDDVADGDEVSRERLDQSVFDLLVGMPANPFFTANIAALLACVSVQIHKWQASDSLERSGIANAKTYMWRAGFYDVVLLVVHLCHGWGVAQKLAPAVLEMYGETFEDYQGEFNA